MQNMKWWLIFWLSALFVILFGQMVYWALKTEWTDTSSMQVQSGSILTSDSWNNMLSNVEILKNNFSNESILTRRLASTLAQSIVNTSFTDVKWNTTKPLDPGQPSNIDEWIYYCWDSGDTTNCWASSAGAVRIPKDGFYSLNSNILMNPSSVANSRIDCLLYVNRWSTPYQLFFNLAIANQWQHVSLPCSTIAPLKKWDLVKVALQTASPVTSRQLYNWGFRSNWEITYLWK